MDQRSGLAGGILDSAPAASVNAAATSSRA